MALKPITWGFLLHLGFADGIQDQLRTKLEGCKKIRPIGTKGP